MNISFLTKLIEKNARVILPDFGAFLVKDDGSGVFKGSNITFSPFLRYNDGMVEDAIASEFHVNQEDAKKQLFSFIETIKEQLQGGNPFSIGEFGSLYRDSRGSIHFSSTIKSESSTQKEIQPEKPKDETVAPSEEVTLVEKEEEIIVISSLESNKKEDDIIEIEQISTDNLNINQEKSVQSGKESSEPTVEAATKEVKVQPNPPKVEEKKSSESKVQDTKKPIQHKAKPHAPVHKHKPAVSKPVSKPVPKPSSNETGEKRIQSGGIGKAILMGTLIALGIVAIAVSWFLIQKGHINIGRTKVQTEIVSDTENESDIIAEEAGQKGKFDDEFESLSTKIDDISKSDDPKAATKQMADTKFSGEKSADQKQKITLAYPTEGMFHLIVGSFRNIEYAEKFASDLKSSGYNSRVITQPSGMHSVSIGSFPSRNQAVEAMNEVKVHQPNVWILKQ